MMLAYIDPGLGALLWQSIMAAFVGFLFYVKKTRRWMVNLVRKVFGRVKTPPAAAPGMTAGTGGLAPKVGSKTETQ